MFIKQTHTAGTSEPLVRQQAPLAFKGFGPRTIAPNAAAEVILILAEQPNCSMLG